MGKELKQVARLIKFDELEFEFNKDNVAEISIHKNVDDTLFYHKGILISFSEIKLTIFKALDQLEYCLDISLNGVSVANLNIQSRIGIKLVPICVGTQVALIRIEELVSEF